MKVKDIEKLWEGVEVEWVKLDEIAKIRNGKDWKIHKDGDIPVYGSGGIMGYIDTYSYNKPTVLIPRKGSITNIFYVETPFWNVDTIYYTEIDTDQIIPKFFFYFIKTLDLMSLDTGSGRPSLTQAILNQIQIPLPPLEIQQKIVGILDNYTAKKEKLTKALSAELTAREKQYEYYRGKLLNFKDLDKEGGGYKWLTMSKLSIAISSGGTPRRSISKYYDNGTVPWLRTQELGYGEIWDTDIKITELGLKNSSAKMIPENCVIVAMYGATVGKVGINKIPLSTNQACANIQVNDKIANYKYIYYYLLNQYEYIKSLGTGSQTNINSRIIKNLKIPVPPLEEQERIVSILDKFDTLIHSISEGLPREIELREKQYEYYRSRLLSFATTE